MLGTESIIFALALSSFTAFALVRRRSKLCNPISGLPNRIAFQRLDKILPNASVSVIKMRGIRLIEFDHDAQASQKCIKYYAQFIQRQLTSHQILFHLTDTEFLLVNTIAEPSESHAELAGLTNKLSTRWEFNGIAYPIYPDIGFDEGIREPLPAASPSSAERYKRGALILEQKHIATLETPETQSAFKKTTKDESLIAKELSRNFCGKTSSLNLDLGFKPMVDPRNATRIRAVELCLVFRHQDTGTLLQQDIVQVCQKYHMTKELINWIFSKTSRVLDKLYNLHGFRGRFFIPVPGSSFDYLQLPFKASAFVHEAKVPPESIVLQLSSVDANYNRNAWNEINSQGIGIAIDNFGTPGSILGMAFEDSVEAVKLSQMVLIKAEKSQKAHNILTNMCRTFIEVNIQVIIPDIQNTTENEIAEAVGPSLVQGPFFYGTLDYKHFVDLIETHSTG